MIAVKPRASRLAPSTSAPSMSGLGKEFGGVAGLDAAAVLDADAFGGGMAEPGAQDFADPLVGLLGLCGRRGLAGADGPDRFVGDDDVGEGHFSVRPARP